MKTHIEELGIFGGPPLFTSPRPIGQLYAPEVDDYLATLKEAFDAHHLTNDGPIVRKLERKLAQFHGTAHCVAVANAGLGITMLMQLFANGRRGEVIMPAFSFRGLPHFAQWAGQLPRFCDVDRTKHTLDANAVDSAISEQTTSILAVCNFNDPGDIEALCSVARYHNVPIFLDSVYAVGSTYQGRILGSFANAEVFSLHATKLLNGFEGGYITTDDDDLAKKIRWQRNFAPPGSCPQMADTEHVIGLNTNLNEMHAAMAFLTIDKLKSIVARNYARYKAYQTGLAFVDGLTLVPYAEGERMNHQLVVMEVESDWPLTRDQTVALLRAEGAAITAYYSPPLHLSEHCPTEMEVPRLPIAEELAEKFVQLPVGELTKVEDIRRICQFLFFIGECGPAVAERLNQRGKL